VTFPYSLVFVASAIPERFLPLREGALVASGESSLCGLRPFVFFRGPAEPRQGKGCYSFFFPPPFLRVSAEVSRSTRSRFRVFLSVDQFPFRCLDHPYGADLPRARLYFPAFVWSPVVGEYSSGFFSPRRLIGFAVAVAWLFHLFAVVPEAELTPADSVPHRFPFSLPCIGVS